MGSMIGLVISDLHLVPEYQTGGLRLTGDCEFALAQLSKLVEQCKPDVIIGAGDFTNAPAINSEEIRLLCDLHNILDNSGAVCMGIQGNHDRGKYFTSALLSSSMSDINGVVMDVDGIGIKGIKNIPDLHTYRELIRASNDCDILVLHARMSPFSNFDGVEALSTDDVPPDVFTIVGDTHVTQYYNNELPFCTGTNKRVLSPGFLFPRNKTELEHAEPAVCILELCKTEGLPVEVVVHEVPLLRRRCCTVTGQESDEELLGIVAANTVSFESRALPPVILIEKEYRNKYKHLDEKVLFSVYVKPSDVSTRKRTVSAGAVTGTLDNRVERAIDISLKDSTRGPAVSALLKELWKSPDPKLTLSEHLNN